MIRLAKVRMTFPHVNHGRNKAQTTAPIATFLLNQSSFREAYQINLSTRLGGNNQGHLDETANQTWETLKKCIVDTAEETLGHSWKKQPDWFQESSDKLKPIIEAKNKARVRMFQSYTETNH